MKIWFFLSLLLVGFQAYGLPSKTDLQEVQQQLRQEQKTQEEMLKKAKTVADEVVAVKQQMVAVANAVQDNEDVLTELEANLSDLEAKKKQVEERLFARKGQMITLLSGLQKMAVYPPESVFFAPQNPIDNLRSSLILKSAKQPLHSAVDKLGKELEKLASLQSRIKVQAGQIKSAASRLADEKIKMEKLLGQKSILQAHFEAESNDAKKRADALGKKAKDIADLLKKLEIEKENNLKKIASVASRQKPVLSLPTLSAKKGAFDKSLGSLPLPARGKIISRYGDKTPGGRSADGLTMQTRVGAQIIAPFDGNVLFAGPFKGYGNLVIIEHGDGYHSLLSGINRIDCIVGQSVLTGEPIGVMSSQKTEKLYIEFRKNGRPVNPANWFASKI